MKYTTFEKNVALIIGAPGGVKKIYGIHSAIASNIQPENFK